LSLQFKLVMVGKLKRLIGALLLRLTRYFSAVLSSADDVRIRVKSGHRVQALQCPLMTQIGNTGGRSARAFGVRPKSGIHMHQL
jgi:hypothetical protein